MNTLLQIGLGLSVSFLAVWIIIIKRKVFRIKTILGAVILTVACGGAVTLGVMEQLAEPVEEQGMSAKQMVSYANSLLAAGEYEEAMKLVKAYSKEYGYDDEAAYIVAKAKALSGNYTEAEGIYARLAQDDKYAEMVEEEMEILQQYSVADASYLPMMELLENNGKDPAEYGYTAEFITNMEKALSITDEQIVDTILEVIEDNYDTDEYEECVEAAAAVKKLYQNQIEHGYYSAGEEETRELEEYIDDLEDAVEEKPEVLHTAFISDARLKSSLLTGDYESFVKNVNEESDYREVMIASQLYLNGVVDGKDFSKEYVGDIKKDFDAVSDQLKKVADKQEDEIGKAEVDEIKEMRESMDNAEDNPALYVMKEQLSDELVNGYTEHSKIELTISQIEHFNQNDAVAKEHFNEAVVTGKDSEDYEYSQAMSQIENIIYNPQSTEIVNIDDYVENAIEHSMPLDSYALLPGSYHDSYVADAEEAEEPRETFSQMLRNYVSEMKSSIVIGQIDASEFDTVKAAVTISSKYAENSDELKRILSVYDCGAEITDFEIEKINYSGIKTMLVCDVSGSMSGSMDDLKNAVNNYVENLKKNESVSIVSFADGIQDSIPFTTDVNTLLDFSNSMEVAGGTQIFDTLSSCISGFDSSIENNDIIILMTDGQDNSPRMEATIRSQIGSSALGKGITVYTVGLGDVDTAYLSTIAESCNGEFVYVSDSGSLVSFYGMLQGQVDNQYMITYKAKDTMLVSNRSLEVKIAEENIFDYKEYSLRVEGDTDGDGISDQPMVDGEDGLSADELSITGLDIRTAYKSKNDIVAHLLGSGFTEDASVTIKLIGDMEYDLKPEFVDETRYKVIIPSTVSIGTYDIKVTINDKSAYIANGFSLWKEGDTYVYKYGPYTFTSMGSKRAGRKTVLIGNVTMNGWLHFNGEVTFVGDRNEDAQIQITDNDGSYVMFDADTATGAGALLAEKGIVVGLPRLGTFNLYNDLSNQYDYTKYPVDNIRTTTMKIINLVQFDAPMIKLYPDNIKLEFKKTSTVLPFQDQIFKAVTGEENPFAFELESSAVVNSKNVGIIFDFKGEDKREAYKDFNLFNAPISLNANELKVSINTIENKYAFGGMIKLKAFDLGIGAEVALNGFTVDEFLITIDKDKTFMVGQVPLTFSKARFGAKDIATALETKNYAGITVVGQLDLAVAKVSAFYPKLKKYVGDMSVASLSDATITFRLKPFSLGTSSSIKIFDEFTVAKTNFVFGNYTYTNSLLGLRNRDVQGFSSSITQGFMWDIDNCHIDISGTGTLTGNNRFMGIQLDGTAELDIEWWIFSKKIDKSGTILTGIYYTESGSPQFTLAVTYQNFLGVNKKLYYYIDANGKTGNKNGTL